MQLCSRESGERRRLVGARLALSLTWRKTVFAKVNLVSFFRSDLHKPVDLLFG